MKRPRFSICSLLLVVLIVAVAVAALHAADDAWDAGIFGLTLLILLTSVLLAVHRNGRRRAFWLGFALFGWAYLVASLISPIGSRLPTTKGLTRLDSLVRPRPWIFDTVKAIDSGNVNWARPAGHTVAFSPQGNIFATSSQGVIRPWDATTGKLLSGPGGTTKNFLRIGHSLLALVLAFVGGSLSRRLYASGRPGRDGEPDVPRQSPADSDVL